LGGQSYAWVDLAVADKDNPDITNRSAGRSQTRMHEYAGDDKARELLWEAINTGLNKWAEEGLDDALFGLAMARFQLEFRFLMEANLQRIIDNHDNPATQR